MGGDWRTCWPAQKWWEGNLSSWSSWNCKDNLEEEIRNTLEHMVGFLLSSPVYIINLIIISSLCDLGNKGLIEPQVRGLLLVSSFLCLLIFLSAAYAKIVPVYSWWKLDPEKGNHKPGSWESVKCFDFLCECPLLSLVSTLRWNRTGTCRGLWEANPNAAWESPVTYLDTG